MREKENHKESGTGATLKGKWPYYEVMNFLEYYLQPRTTEMFHRHQLQIEFHSLIQVKLKWAILNK